MADSVRIPTPAGGDGAAEADPDSPPALSRRLASGMTLQAEPTRAAGIAAVLLPCGCERCTEALLAAPKVGSVLSPNPNPDPNPTPSSPLRRWVLCSRSCAPTRPTPSSASCAGAKATLRRRRMCSRPPSSGGTTLEPTYSEMTPTALQQSVPTCSAYSTPVRCMIAGIARAEWCGLSAPGCAIRRHVCMRPPSSAMRTGPPPGCGITCALTHP